VQADAEDILAMAASIRREYLAGEAPFQEHILARAHVYDFLVRHGTLVRDWAVRTAEAMRALEHLSPDEQRQRALDYFERSTRS
jgi:hypothetical protein